MIYLACPYSHRDPEVQEYRFRESAKHAARLMGRGLHVFSPLTHAHPIHLHGHAPAGWGFWRDFDLWFVGRCDKVVVLKLPGWEDSTGVREEVAFANENNIPVEFVEP